MNIELTHDDIVILKEYLGFALDRKVTALNEEREYMQSCSCSGSNRKKSNARIAELETDVSELRSLLKKINGENNTRTVNDYITHNVGSDVEIIIETTVPGTFTSKSVCYYKGLLDAVPEKLRNLEVIERSWSLSSEMWILGVACDFSLLDKEEHK